MQASRLLCPWDFPGKNTGVGCHFLLQKICPAKGLNWGLPQCRQALYHQENHQKVPPYLFNLLQSLCFVTIFYNYIPSPKFIYPHLKLSFPAICSVYPLWELKRQLKPKLYDWIPSQICFSCGLVHISKCQVSVSICLGQILRLILDFSDSLHGIHQKNMWP